MMLSKLKNEQLKPNKYSQFFQHREWEIIGLLNDVVDANLVHKQKNTFVLFVKNFVKEISGTIGFFIFVILFFLILIIPETTKYDPTIVDLYERNAPAFSGNHILGTTELGVDIWAQLWHGARYSLGLSISAAVSIFVIGMLIGLLMGYFNRFDKVMGYIIMVLQNIPTLPLLIILILIYGSSFGIIILVFSLTGWIGLALQIRAQILRGKNMEWVTASKVLGTGNLRIIKSLIPRALPIILTIMVTAIPGFIIAEITLAVLGLIPATQVSLGIVINSAIDIVNIDPSKIVIPSLILVVLTTSLILVGNGIQESLRRTR